MGYIKKFGVLSGLILIALGVVCYLLENQVVAFFGIAAGILLLVFGGYFLVGSLIQRQYGNMSVVKLIAGIFISAERPVSSASLGPHGSPDRSGDRNYGVCSRCGSFCGGLVEDEGR